MLNTRVQRPPPPRRAPPAAAMIKDVSPDAYISTHVILRLSGAAVISQQLLQVKDWVSDIKMAVTTADDALKAISTNPAVQPPSLSDGATTGGDDVQSLAFASVALSKLAEEEETQDAFYAKLSETAFVRAEVQMGSQDARLQRYKQQVECQLASSMADGLLPPQQRKNSVPPEKRQMLLNPYSTVRRKLPNTASNGNSALPSANTPMPPTITSPYRTSTSSAVPSPQSPSYSTPAAVNGGYTSYSPHSSDAAGSPSRATARYGATATQQPLTHGAHGHRRPLRRGNAIAGMHFGQPPQPLHQNHQQSSRPHYQAL
ncbi:hypothetical protein conserved [Leishmania donovani]|uniref:Uncharacterized protein n=3 Tax=Leishmania donovani species complex TaxID=38574 RepID=A4I2T8_LEIIN|nr:hypothetical protein, unknown function [Leishmania infantum JPCM5]CAC9499740.1 hypothetical_protein_-_conserved [Leishmania infantum]CAJ1990006.1 hypothetical protein conserved [Leishmania donovani]CAM69088.1 hypothetical protein, unknown function [Leishmania infantum JPCM5]SUZ43025.1 hypothetical_protein_-_conserved [Leishmania infantum]VDZ45866.1 hypothetical_protein_conserved [Leishmania donovani]|eukprot:XP_001466371.1 hypothetical protein, unknown function [Leishmania infantum JPCM5]